MTKRIRRLAILGSVLALMLVADVAPQVLWLPSDLQMMSTDAHAIAGRQRRTRRRGAAVGYQAGKASANAANQQAAAAEQPAAPAEQPAAAAPAPAPTAAPAPVPGALAIGTIVTELPAGCPKTVIGGVEYFTCGGNYYQAALQGSQLVYITAQPQ